MGGKLVEDACETIGDDCMKRSSLWFSLVLGSLALPLSWATADLVRDFNGLGIAQALGSALGVAVVFWAGLLMLWKRRPASPFAHSQRRGVLKSLIPIVVGVLGAFIVLVALFPTTCSSTLIGSLPGSPDPNTASCKSALFRELGTLGGGSSETVMPDRTSLDVLTQRLIRNAMVLAAIPLVGGLAWGWASRRERSRIEHMRR